MNAPGMRIGPPARRVGTPHPRVPGRRAWEVITPEGCLPRSWSTSWLLGRPGREGKGKERKGREASNAGQRRRTDDNAGQRGRADDNAGHPLRAETLLDAELISRYGVPPSQHRWPGPGLSRCPISTTGPLGGGHLCTASASQKSERKAATIRFSKRERHRNQRPAPASSRASALARPRSESAGRPSAQRRCPGHLRTTHLVDAAGDRRCRRYRRGGPTAPAEEMIPPQPHTGGLSALNPKPWAGPRAGSPRTSGPDVAGGYLRAVGRRRRGEPALHSGRASAGHAALRARRRPAHRVTGK